MLFGRRKPGYTTTVDSSVDPEQAVLDLQKAALAAKKSPRQRCSTSMPPARRPAA